MNILPICLLLLALVLPHAVAQHNPAQDEAGKGGPGQPAATARPTPAPAAGEQASSQQSQAVAVAATAPSAFKSVPLPPALSEFRTSMRSSTTADQFEFLRDRRKSALDVMANVAARIDTVTATLSSQRASLREQDDFALEPDRIKPLLENTLERLSILEQEEKQARSQAVSRAIKDEIASLKNRRSAIEQDLKRIERRDRAKSELSRRIEALEAEVEMLRNAYQAWSRHLASIDDMVNQLFIANDAANAFKLQMSLAFSILVGVVIVGFFVVAWSNDEIKKSIFSNDAGIQFITIFSIVIAVILFGIIGVLESKELSALLGGLSGYILGRTRSKAD